MLINHLNTIYDGEESFPVITNPIALKEWASAIDALNRRKANYGAS